MTANPGDRYRVSCSRALLERLRRWGQTAQRIGLGEDYAAALRQIQEQLETVPLEWGDPQYRLDRLGLLVLRGSHPLFYVWYAVHSVHRVVFLQSFQLVPGHPLQQACDEEGLA